MKSVTSICLLLTIAVCHGALVKAPSGGNFELLILHNNDMHARFEQTSRTSGACTAADREAGKCYGGFPRVAHVVKEARAAAQTGQGPPVLYLNAGDTYTGTAWFTIYKWKIAAEFINALQPDAVSLGNHEFDEGVDGLIPFIRNISTPVVAANVILDKVPDLEQEHNLHKSVIIVKNGVKIGIIGYLTAETKFLAPKNNVEYEDEIKSIKKEVQKLKNVGVNIFIALGHSGFIKDLAIAKHVEDIDLVIGGHSNTFLSNSKTTDGPEIIEGSYPIEISQKSGRIVRVVQAYAYTKYLGSLRLIFDYKGEIVHCDGTPLLLDQTIPKDPEVLSMVDKYRKEIGRINNVVVGTSSVTLHGDYCRLRECNIGDVLTDAMVNYTRENFGDRYQDVGIGIIQGGRIRTSIDRPQKPFEMTRGDWLTVIPFTDPLTVVNMNGSVLLQSLEHAVEDWRQIDSPGQFLQISGMRVTYDLAKPAGSRIVSAQAIYTNSGQLTDIKEDYEYKVLMSDFLAQGGDSFEMFEGLPKEILSYNEIDSIIYYLNKHGIISQEETGRITLLNSDKVKNPQMEFVALSINSSSTMLSVYHSVLYVLVILISLTLHI